MGLSLDKYIDFLEKQNLNWPKAPPRQPVKAKPMLRAIPGIKAVCWESYGTLMRIAEGELRHQTEHRVPLQVALSKTIQQYNMWNSMHRKPGEPWEVLLPQYQKLLEEQQMVGVRKGDLPEIDSSAIWKKIFDRLRERDYQYDVRLLGEPDELSEKVAYFFHACLQGVEPESQSAEVLQTLHAAGLHQGLVDNGQKFTFFQTLRHLQCQGRLNSPEKVISRSLSLFSVDVGIRAESESFFRQVADRYSQAGLNPRQIVYVGSKLQQRLALARQAGFRTILYAGDAVSLRATNDGLRDPQSKPDCLITELNQLKQVLNLS
ncbi:MAG: HAD family hydrolase [Planctomycetaceae bacterium]|nr:HAD family hydrolase [Planctomycetaceae bacterium]